MFEKEDREQEPYMATVRASRVSGNAALFDSEHRHQHYIVLTVNSAYRHRHLSGDWIHADKELIEVAMTEAQWASMISSMNFGSGVPATLQHIQQERVEQPTVDDRTSAYHGELTEHVEEAIEKLYALRDTRLTKGQQKDIDLIIQELNRNLPFVAKQFDEHMEKRTEKAKSDIEAYMNNAIQRAGFASLQEQERRAALPQEDTHD